MAPPVVTVMAKKGGTGKTTVTQGLASAARAKGLRVWVADFDPQTNLTNLLIGPRYRELAAKAARKEAPRPAALFDVLSEEEPAAADIRLALYEGSDKWSGVSVLPATARLDLIEHAPQDPKTAGRFQRAIRDIDGPDAPDLILCDTRPAFNLLTVQAAVAATIALVCVEPERFPLEGLKEAWKTLTALKDNGALPDLREAAVIKTKVDRRRAEHRTRLPEIERAYGPVLWEPEFPSRAVISTAISAGIPLHDYPDDRTAECTAVLDTWLDMIMKKVSA